jgi:hypothetical protein
LPQSTQYHVMLQVTLYLRSNCNSHWFERDLLISTMRIIDIPIPTITGSCGSVLVNVGLILVARTFKGAHTYDDMVQFDGRLKL